MTNSKEFFAQTEEVRGCIHTIHKKIRVSLHVVEFFIASFLFNNDEVNYLLKKLMKFSEQILREFVKTFKKY